MKKKGLTALVCAKRRGFETGMHFELFIVVLKLARRIFIWVIDVNQYMQVNNFCVYAVVAGDLRY